MIEVLAQATEQVSQNAASQPEGITGSIQGALGCLGAAIGVGIVGMKGVEAVGRNPDASGAIFGSIHYWYGTCRSCCFLLLILGLNNLLLNDRVSQPYRHRRQDCHKFRC